MVKVSHGFAEEIYPSGIKLITLKVAKPQDSKEEMGLVISM